MIVVVQEYQHGDKRDESLEDTGRFEGVQEKRDDVSSLAFKGRRAAVESEGIVQDGEQEDKAREGVGGRAGCGQEDGLARGQSAQVWVVVYLLLDTQQYAGVPLVQAGDAVVLFHCVGEALHVLVLQVLRQDLQHSSFVMRVAKGYYLQWNRRPAVRILAEPLLWRSSHI